MSEPTIAPVRWAKAFGHFWWEFLVGDTPELFLAVVAILVVIAVVTHLVATTVAWVLLPILVIAALSISVWRACRPRSR